jgi:ribosomal protein S11
MANSYVDNSGSDSALSISGLKYISGDDLKAAGTTDGGTTWTTLSIASKALTASPPTVTVTNGSSYTTVRVYRDTSITQLVDFQSGARITETDLDTAYQQGLYAAQEVKEDPINKFGRGYCHAKSTANNTAVTTVSSAGVYYTAVDAGAFTIETGSNFTVPAAAAAQVKYTGDGPKIYKVEAHISIKAAGGTPVAALGIGKNGTEIQSTVVNEGISATDSHMGTTGLVSLTTNNTVEIRVANETNTENLTVTHISLVLTPIA